MPPSAATTMLSNISNTRRRRGYTPPPRAPIWPLSAGLCAAPQIIQPSASSHAQPPFPPGRRWEESPYTFIPLPDLSNTSSNAQSPEIEALAAVDSTLAQPPRLTVQPIALPAQITGITAVALNPALRADFGAGAPRSAHPGVGVDFATGALNNDDENHCLWAEPATCPGLPALTLTSALLPWMVTAHASGGCVTVGDILQAIHRTLSIRVTDEEFRECMQGPRLDYVTEQDSKIPQEPVSQKNVSRGMTRLDLLGGRHRFAGLSESGMGYDIWVVGFI
ncbi:hypothetical protein FB451DRAFT_1126407 [Mycena latifolia]|nr:hypothetical protein FB451DRAFT_1126407 [Mycena latifolia]